MPNRIITILGRLRQDIAACLTPEAIEAAARQAGHSWRKRAPRPRHHHLPLLDAGPPRQHRLSARRPFRRLVVHRFGLLPGPQATPAGGLSRPPGADRRDVPGRHGRRPPTGSGIASGSSTAPGSRCPTSPNCNAISASRGTRTGLRLPRGAVAGSVRRGDRDAAPLGDGAAADPRHGPGRGGRRRAGAGRCRAGRLGSARMLTSPGCTCAACTACSACISGGSSTSHRGVPGPGEVEAGAGGRAAPLAVGAGMVNRIRW